MMKLAVIASVLALSATGAFAGDDGPERLRWSPESPSANKSGPAAKIWTVDDEDEDVDERGNRFGFRGDDDDRGSRLGFRNNDDDEDGRGSRLWRGGEEDGNEGEDD